MGGKHKPLVVEYRHSMPLLKGKQGWSLKDLNGLFNYLNERGVSSILLDMWLTKMNEGGEYNGLSGHT